MQSELNALFRRYQEGDEVAFCALYEMTSGSIWSFIRKRVPHTRHEDCFQQFWLHLHTKKHLYQGQPVLPWMFVILRHLIIDDYRSQKNVTLQEEADDTEELRALLDDALSELPAQDKVLIERIYFQGFNYQDLEKEWGLSQTGLRKRLSRGIGSLAKKFKDSK
ncbi:MAG TPA: sigma-70 family RNA polymerase sigma factor [Bacteriovoracaceae bacterium]|nr:sigma-70 family RNA polymerase sigma factor [Bacteriovoracaceae bacterium]